MDSGELAAFVASTPAEDLTVTGFPRCGHILELVGEDAFGLDGFSEQWPTRHAIIMLQYLRPKAAELLESLGVADARRAVSILPYGTGLLLSRAVASR